MISCVIIDDQKEAIEILSSHVNNRTELELVSAFDNSTKAYNFLLSNKVDLVFIDIRMPKMTGIDMIETLRLAKGNDVPKFIITTGFDKYALSGFEQGVIDYLMKPITFKRFCISIDRFISDYNLIKQHNYELTYLFIEQNNRKLKIDFSEIVYIEAEGNYINVKGLNFRYLVYNTLGNIIKTLPSNQFIRIHKSFIVSIDYIDYIKGDEIFLKALKDSACIPIGASFKEALNKQLKL